MINIGIGIGAPIIAIFSTNSNCHSKLAICGLQAVVSGIDDTAAAATATD